MNDSTFIGTKLPGEDYRLFGIRAAERGTSKSGLLRKLALDFLSADTTRRSSAATESAARRATPRKAAKKKGRAVA